MAPETIFLYLQPAITVSSDAHEGRYVGQNKDEIDASGRRRK
jgi:hypothetical protein